MKIKNKHGRVGVKKYKPNRPLADDQKAEVYERAWKTGYAAGEKSIGLKALELVNTSKNIREARRRLEELING